MMITMQICPNCKQENKSDAQKCVYCGTSLVDGAFETMRVDDLASELKRPEAVTTSDLQPGVLALYVMGEKEPIVVENQPTVTLGRIVFGEPTPTVDLTEYHGRLLGVSRHHAAIHQFEDGFKLEDLDSSNGTWLNDNHLTPNELTPLHDGDLIRLGQLVLLTHFQETTPAIVSDSNSNHEVRRKTPTRPLDVGTDIRSMSVTLMGRPSRVDIRPDGVMATLLYKPEPETLPEGAPILFYTPRIYSIYIPTKLWKKIEPAFNDPHDQLIIEGSCAYDSEAGQISILATAVSSKHMEAHRAQIIARKNRRQDQLLNLIQNLRRW
jgi:hypothetical protein